MNYSHIETGKIGEENSITYLNKMGYDILKRNYKTPFGELDVIAKESGAIVFIEIKTRRSRAYGMPEESVHLRKQRKLIQSAQCYLKQNRSLSKASRFDVLSVLIRPSGQFEFNLIQNAFEV